MKDDPDLVLLLHQLDLEGKHVLKNRPEQVLDPFHQFRLQFHLRPTWRPDAHLKNLHPIH